MSLYADFSVRWLAAGGPVAISASAASLGARPTARQTCKQRAPCASVLHLAKRPPQDVGAVSRSGVRGMQAPDSGASPASLAYKSPQRSCQADVMHARRRAPHMRHAGRRSESGRRSQATTARSAARAGHPTAARTAAHPRAAPAHLGAARAEQAEQARVGGPARALAAARRVGHRRDQRGPLAQQARQRGRVRQRQQRLQRHEDGLALQRPVRALRLCRRRLRARGTEVVPPQVLMCGCMYPPSLAAAVSAGTSTVCPAWLCNRLELPRPARHALRDAPRRTPLYETVCNMSRQGVCPARTSGSDPDARNEAAVGGAGLTCVCSAHVQSRSTPASGPTAPRSSAPPKRPSARASPAACMRRLRSRRCGAARDIGRAQQASDREPANA